MSTDTLPLPEPAGCAVPLLEQLRSVPADWREMREVGDYHHRNVPYGRMMNDAADALEAANARTADLEAEVAQYKEALETIAYAVTTPKWIANIAKEALRVDKESELCYPISPGSAVDYDI